MAAIIKKTFLALFACLICLSCTAIAEDKIAVSQAFYQNGDIVTRISNNDISDIDNVRVRAIILDFGIISPAVTVDLDDDERTTARMHIFEDVPPGEHLVRITVGKKGQRKVAYRYVLFE